MFFTDKTIEEWCSYNSELIANSYKEKLVLTNNVYDYYKEKILEHLRTEKNKEDDNK